jgi:hypothetical protein
MIHLQWKIVKITNKKIRNHEIAAKWLNCTGKEHHLSFLMPVWKCSCCCFLKYFSLEIYQNNIFFYFFKIIFDNKASK